MMWAGISRRGLGDPNRAGRDEGGDPNPAERDEWGDPNPAGRDEGGDPNPAGRDEGGDPNPAGRDEGGDPNPAGRDSFLSEGGDSFFLSKGGDSFLSGECVALTMTASERSLLPCRRCLFISDMTPESNCDLCDLRGLGLKLLEEFSWLENGLLSAERPVVPVTRLWRSVSEFFEGSPGMVACSL